VLTAALNAKTSTSITLDLAGRTTGTYNQVEYQYSARCDFEFALAPSVVIATAASITLQSLSQANTYFVRVRERKSADGTVGPWTVALPVYLPPAVAPDTAPLSIMIRPAIVVVPEVVTWSVSGGADAGHPADNLASDAPNEQFWFTPNSLYFDTGGQPIDTVALLGTNIPEGVTWRLETFTTAANRAAVTSIQFTSGDQQFRASLNVPGRPSYHGLMRLAAPRLEPFWRIVFTAATGSFPPGNIIAAMFAIAGLARTSKNIAADKVESPLDYGSIERTRDGVPDRRYGWRGRRVEFEIALQTEAQWETQFADLRHKIGLTDPVLVVPNTRTGAFLHDRILFGPVTANRAQQPYTPRFTQGFTIDSLI
jgi:hypothetical protein